MLNISTRSRRDSEFSDISFSIGDPVGNVAIIVQLSQSDCECSHLTLHDANSLIDYAKNISTLITIFDRQNNNDCELSHICQEF